MIHGYHVVMPMYGFRLPNDPRGSWSDYVRQWELACFGRSTQSNFRRSYGELTEYELSQRDAAVRALRYPVVSIDGQQAQCIANAFAKHCQRNRYTLWACSILPEHTHLVIARHTFAIEQMVNLLKGAASRAITKSGWHPLGAFKLHNGRHPPMWSSHEWRVYLDSETAIEQAIHYVEENPAKEGKPRQHWKFVTPFAGIRSSGWTSYH